MAIPQIAIVVCTYNGAETLGAALTCMIRQETDGMFDFDLVVVDDGSTDGTKDVVAEVMAGSPVMVRCISTEGKGVSHARNRGVAESRGEWIAFFDQDQLAESHWLRVLYVTALTTGADVVEGPRDLALPQEQLSNLSSVCRRTLGERIGGPEPHKTHGRTCSCTGNVLISRKVFNVIGGFDESLLRGGEDWEFFRRVRKAGFDIWYAPRALVHHLIPSERLTETFFKRASLRVGIYFADRDYADWGLTRTVLVWIARIGQALVIHAPLLLWAYLTDNRREGFDRMCYLIRFSGYTRRLIAILAPSPLFQKNYFDQFDLRREKNDKQ
ncbi:MAG: glycosyltransferase family 2 protein [Candidatus Methanospirareceae archaeon]